MSTTIWLNGELLAGDRPAISAADHGLLVGDGVFETAKVVGGQAFALRRHLERLRRSAEGLGLELPRSDDDLTNAVAAVIEANQRIVGVNLKILRESCRIDGFQRRGIDLRRLRRIG